MMDKKITMIMMTTTRAMPFESWQLFTERI